MMTGQVINEARWAVLFWLEMDDWLETIDVLRNEDGTRYGTIYGFTGDCSYLNGHMVDRFALLDNGEVYVRDTHTLAYIEVVS